MKKADIFLLLGILGIASILLLTIQLGVKKMGETAVIKVDGVVVKELSLHENTKVEIEGYQGGINQVIVEDGKVFMSYADCPDVLCVRTGKISKTGETIVCLPHRIVVEIQGAKEAYDSVVQ